MWTYSQPAVPRRRPAASVPLPVVARRPPRDAFAGAAFDPAELLDVDVDELARPRALVADGLLEPEPAEPAHPDRFRIPETVESAIPSVSAISAAVKRSRRSLTIASTRSAGVRFATRLGADERSRRPGSPSSR